MARRSPAATYSFQRGDSATKAEVLLLNLVHAWSPLLLLPCSDARLGWRPVGKVKQGFRALSSSARVYCSDKTINRAFGKSAAMIQDSSSLVSLSSPINDCPGQSFIVYTSRFSFEEFTREFVRGCQGLDPTIFASNEDLDRWYFYNIRGSVHKFEDAF